MAPGGEISTDLLRKRGVELNLVGRHHHAKPRCVAGLLGIHAEVEHIDEHLHLPLRMVVEADAAQQKLWHAIAEHHARKDRMPRTVPGHERVGVAAHRGKLAGPIVEDHPGLACQQARSKRPTNARHQRHGVAGRIDRADGGRVGGVASLGVHGRGRPVGDPLPRCGEPRARECAADTFHHRPGQLSDLVDRKLKPQSEGLDLMMETIRFAHAREVVALENAECDQGHRALGIGRQAKHMATSIADRKRLRPLGFLVGDVCRC